MLFSANDLNINVHLLAHCSHFHHFLHYLLEDTRCLPVKLLMGQKNEGMFLPVELEANSKYKLWYKITIRITTFINCQPNLAQSLTVLNLPRGTLHIFQKMVLKCFLCACSSTALETILYTGYKNTHVIFSHCTATKHNAISYEVCQ